MLQLIARYINNILIVSSILFLLIFLIVFNFSPGLINNFYKINNFVIKGNKLSIESSITEIVSEHRGKSIINFPLSEYKLKVEQLDWIKRVSITRHFPDTINLIVIENRPHAIFFSNNKEYLIDDDGDIITLKDKYKYNDLLKVSGANGNINFPDLIREINISYPKILDKLVEVEFIEKRRWNLILDQNIKIKLPEKNSSIQLKELKKLDQKIFNSNIIEIDLREVGKAILKVPGGEELKNGLNEV